MKHIKSPLILITYFVLANLNLQAQNSSEQIGIPSPTATSLGVYGETPVSLFTGSINPSIPLYGAKSRDLALPITLSYNGTGIKVSEMPSWVGLKWSLDAGGVITRVVRGRPDDESSRGYLATNDLLDEFISGTYYGGDPLEDCTTYINDECRYYLLQKLKTGAADSEPDHFYLNYPGGSGKFYLDLDDEVVLEGYSPLKISFTSPGGQTFVGGGPQGGDQNFTGISEWTVYDQSGTKYTFSEKEYSFDQTSRATPITSASPYISAWYLTNIESANGADSITISYSDPVIVNRYNTTYNNKYVAGSQNCSDLGGSQNQETSVHTRYGLVWPEEIITANEIIRFNTGTKSSNVVAEGEKKLTSIDILTTDERLKKTFTMDYDSSWSSRSLLTLVQEEDSLGNKLPAHTFEYNTSTTLPDIDNYDVDHWGFYNSEGNSILIPTVSIPGLYTGSGANREPNSSYADLGMLEKISFPTGGSTTFEYESHNFGAIGDDLVTTSYTSDESGLLETNNAQVETVEYEFLVSSSDGGNVNIDITSIIDNSMATISTPHTKIVDDVGTQKYYHSYKSVGTSTDTDAVSLAPGTYTLILEDTSPQGGINVSIEWLNSYPITFESPSATELAGGPRIKKITQNDGISSANNIIKEYTYKLESDAQRSSGVLSRRPRYYYISKSGTLNSGDRNNGTNCSYVGLSAQSILTLGSGGAPVEYREVKEEITSGASSGHTIFKFETSYDHTIEDLVAGGDNWPYPIIGDRSKLRGNLRTKLVYNGAGELLLKESPEHDLLLSGKVEGVSFKQDYPVKDYYDKVPVFYSLYSNYLFWKPKVKQTNTTYEYPANFSTISELEYDTSTHNVTQKTETNSDGTERVTKYRYAHEEYTAMEDSNMLTQPYSVTLEDGSGNVLSKSWTVWSASISDNSNWNVEEQWQWEGSGSTDTNAAEDPDGEAVKLSEITEYNEFGNPLEIKDIKGVYTSYKWSEDGTIPLGIFQNADKDDVFAHSFAKDGLAGWTEVNASNGVTTSWTIEDGRLKMYHPGTVGSSWSADYVKVSLTSEYTDRTVIEMDVTIGNDNYYSLSIGAGGNGYPGGNGGSENLIWTSFTNGTWKYYNGSTFLDIKTGFVTNQTYALKIVADPITDKVDYYVDGEKVKTAVDGRIGTSGIQTIGIGNYGRSSIASTFYIDNVRIYPEEAQAQSQEVDEVLGTTLTVKDVNGFTKRFAYDEFGRLTEAYNTHGELVASNNYYYSLEDNSTYDSADPNRVESWTHYDPGTPSNATKSVSYLDGLGRGIQSQLRGGSTTIITDTRYNERGLPEVTSRPFEQASQPAFKQNAYEGSSGSFTPGQALHTTSEIENEYASLPNNDGGYAYSQVEYEASPLARVAKSTLPGTSHKMGSGKEITTTYGLNTTESFTINGKTWAANTLSKTVSKDPEGNETITYTDGWGQTIVSGTNMNPASDDVLNKSTSDLVIYFEYDLRGNLVRVEDPRGLATTYTYNQKGKLTSKKLPDQDYSVEYKYDEKGRLRFTQDPNQKSGKQDISQYLYGGTSVSKTIVVNSDGKLELDFYVYDLYLDDYTYKIEHVDNGNAVLYSGSFSSDDTDDHSLVVGSGIYKFTGEAVDNGEPIVGSGGIFSFTSFDIYTYTKYDELDRPIEVGEYAGGTSFSSANPDTDTFPTSGNEASIQYYYDGDQAYSGSLTPQNMQGRISKVSYRDLSVSTSTWGYTYYSYNSLGLVEWVVQELPGLAEKTIEYAYDELGRMTQMDYQAGESDAFYQRYSFDALGRMDKVETSTNGSTWIKDAEYTSYLADGQVAQMKLGNSAIQTVDYTYTVQGWLDKINNLASIGSDEFAMDLAYNLNGNISQQQWRQPDLNGNLATYSYSYDNANRLTAANFSGSGSGYTSNSFDLKFMNYDKNGNITGYDRRNNSGGTDLEGFGSYGMSFESNSNRIDKVTEQGEYIDFDIDHDASGNMTKNMLQGFTSVDYDWRNLPSQLIKGASTLQYAYDAEGNRVKKKMGSTETHYVRGAGGETLAMYQADTLVYHNIVEGANIIGNHKNGERKYFLKDHLGSVRTTVDDAGAVRGYDDYYPFGLVMPGRSSNTGNPNDKYKFTGHERDDEAGLDIYYMGARYSDPILGGRFYSIDPLAREFPNISPYAYGNNNPLRFTDPTGMAPEECCFETLIPIVAAAYAKNKDKSVSINYNMELSGGFQVAAESRTAGFGGGFTFDLGSIKLAEVSGTATISMDGIEFSDTNNDLKTKGDDVEISQEISGSAPFVSMGAAHDFSLRKSGGNTYVSNQEVSVSRTVGVEKSTDNTNLKTGDRSLTNTIEASRNTAFVFGFKRSLSIKTSERKPIEKND